MGAGWKPSEHRRPMCITVSLLQPQPGPCEPRIASSRGLILAAAAEELADAWTGKPWAPAPARKAHHYRKAPVPVLPGRLFSEGRGILMTLKTARWPVSCVFGKLGSVQARRQTLPRSELQASGGAATIFVEPTSTHYWALGNWSAPIREMS